MAAAKPPLGVTLTVVVLDAPAATVAPPGLRVSAKSGMGAAVTVTLMAPEVEAIKPDSFWRSPQFLELAPERHYLLGLWPGTYSFGGLTVAHGGFKLGTSTFNKSPFKIAAGKVVYIGQHEFIGTSANTFSWDVSDKLAESLAGLNPKQKELIEGWPIDKQIPMIAPAAQ